MQGRKFVQANEQCRKHLIKITHVQVLEMALNCTRSCHVSALHECMYIFSDKHANLKQRR